MSRADFLKRKQDIIGLMEILKDVSLSDYSTMALGGKAANLVSVSSKDELLEAVNLAKEQNLGILMVGSGSNIVWRDEGYNGLIVVNNILGFETTETDEATLINVGSGEDWDEVVKRTCDLDLSGIEALSLIPGKAGSTPVQNVGAYGQDISDTLVSLEAYDLETKQFIEIKNEDCGFGYRTSRFKTNDRGRFLITRVKLKLTKTVMQPPFYRTLEKYLDENNIQDYSPNSIRSAVISIRQAKLPDPKFIHNVGSFFANPIVPKSVADNLKTSYEDMPAWPAGEDVKIPAAWLIEQAGFKDTHDDSTGMATWASQPLVLVNENANSTKDLLVFKASIVDAVNQQFGIELKQEPELLP
jgi:UDP-N-acetylmuramate dehydrogenase